MTTPSRLRPISRSDARAQGITLRELLSGDYQRVFFDTYVRSRLPLRLRDRADIALSVIAPGSFVSHHTAAHLRGGCVPPTESVHVSVPITARRSERRGICAHRASGDDVTLVNGTPASSAVQCFRELAADGVGLVDLVVLGDSLVKAGALEISQLLEAAEGWRGRGSKTARRAVTFVRAGVDSPQESRLRMLIVLAGLPGPR